MIIPSALIDCIVLYFAHRLKGVRTYAGTVEEVELNAEREVVDEEECIEGKLERALRDCQQPPPMWIVHAPPFQSCGDFTHRGTRDGSIALR